MKEALIINSIDRLTVTIWWGSKRSRFKILNMNQVMGPRPVTMEASARWLWALTSGAGEGRVLLRLIGGSFIGPFHASQVYFYRVADKLINGSLE